jgi:hypothetical protein
MEASHRGSSSLDRFGQYFFTKFLLFKDRQKTKKQAGKMLVS